MSVAPCNDERATRVTIASTPTVGSTDTDVRRLDDEREAHRANSVGDNVNIDVAQELVCRDTSTFKGKFICYLVFQFLLLINIILKLSTGMSAKR